MALVGTEAIVNDLNEKIANAERYIANIGDPVKVAGAQKKLDEYIEDRNTVIAMDPDWGDPIPASQDVAPEETGNKVVDSANVLSSILNSPLYTQAIKDAYLSDYLPGLTQANYQINAARAREVKDAVRRQQAQTEALREVAGNYAARGMLRGGKTQETGRAPIQRDFDEQAQSVQDSINALVANKEVLYGAGAEDGETFISDPTLFGAVGAGARRDALSRLQSLPTQYGLTQVENASSSPLKTQTEYVPEGPVVYPGSDEKTNLSARIAAAKDYISRQEAKGATKFVEGGKKKLAEYEEQFKALG